MRHRQMMQGVIIECDSGILRLVKWLGGGDANRLLHYHRGAAPAYLDSL